VRAFAAAFGLNRSDGGGRCGGQYPAVEPDYSSSGGVCLMCAQAAEPYFHDDDPMTVEYASAFVPAASLRRVLSWAMHHRTAAVAGYDVGPGPPGRLSAIRVLHRKSVLYGAFVWARGALKHQKRRFPARADLRLVPLSGCPLSDFVRAGADTTTTSIITRTARSEALTVIGTGYGIDSSPC
jgi:hypothetical protein